MAHASRLSNFRARSGPNPVRQHLIFLKTIHDQGGYSMT
jgi:hypothetical protein